jgi:hypothetical protein
MHSADTMVVRASNLSSWTELLEFQGDLSAVPGPEHQELRADGQSRRVHTPWMSGEAL